MGPVASEAFAGIGLFGEARARGERAAGEGADEGVGLFLGQLDAGVAEVERGIRLGAEKGPGDDGAEVAEGVFVGDVELPGVHLGSLPGSGTRATKRSAGGPGLAAAAAS